MSRVLQASSALLARPPIFLLCDIQERFEPLIHNMSSLIHTSEVLVRGAVALNSPLIATEQYPKALGHTVPVLRKYFSSSSTSSTSTSTTTSPQQTLFPVYPKSKFSMLTPEVKEQMSKVGGNYSWVDDNNINNNNTSSSSPSSSGAPAAVVLFGIEAHVCILQTVLELRKSNVEVYLPVDAISSQRVNDRSAALHTAAGAGAVLTTTESLLFQIMGDAKHPQFKKISPLLVDYSNDIKNTLLSVKGGGMYPSMLKGVLGMP